MKRFLAILFFISCSAKVFAQVNTLADSLYFLQTGKHFSQKDTIDNVFYIPVSQDIYFNKLRRFNNDFSQSNATQLVADSNRRAGFLQFSYLNTKGGLHSTQQAYKTQQAEMYTEGFSTIGRVKISGKFRFNKFWQDSLANNLNASEDGITPYYYFTPKAGTYEGQDYAMSSIVAYNALKDKLYLGLQADYKYHWITGSVDPRIDDKNLQVNFYPSITWRMNKTLVGIEYLIGYGDETMSIAYKSSVYNLSTMYPERFYYLNMGYGDIALKYNVVNSRDANNHGLGLRFSTSVNEFVIQANASYQKSAENNRQIFDTARISDLFSKWSTNRYSAEILINKRTSAATHQLLIKTLMLNGNDFNTLYGGSNYSASQKNLLLRYDLLTRKKESTQWEYGIFVRYNEGRQKDILAAHYIDYGIIHPGISGDIYLINNRKNRIDIGLEPSLILPLKNVIDVPITQTNVFTQTIAYPDFYYRSARLFNTDARINFMTPELIPGVYSGFFVKASYLVRLSEKAFQEIPQQDDTGKKRFSVQFGFNVYL